MIMKKYIFILSIVAFGLTSCGSDYLERAPQSSEATATILGSTEAAKLAVNGICRAMTNQYLGTQGLNGEGSIKNWYGSYPGNDTQKTMLTGWSGIINGTYHMNTTSVYLYYPWFYYYKLIGNANGVICNIDNAEGPEAEKAFLKAQALVFRAYSFFRLAELYAHRWSDEQGNTPGIVLRIDESTGDHPRATLAQTYQQIYADLDEAISLFQSSGMDRSSDDFYKPNLNVAYAVYAKAALTREDWANAAKYAKMARDGYALMSVNDYKAGFNKPNSEWIWGVYEAEDQTLYYYGFFAYMGSNASGSICRNYPFAISKQLIEQIPETDVRRDLYLIPTETELAETYTSEGSTYYCISRTTSEATRGAFFNRGKALRSPTNDGVGYMLYQTNKIVAYSQMKLRAAFMAGGGSFPLFRTEEMYYIEAEADCHLNQAAQAQQLLYDVTSKYDPSYQKSTKTGTALLDEVKLYRRFGLWGEGYDWFDHKRWGASYDRKTWANGGSWHSTFAISVGPDGANHWTWELPNRETDYNKGLTLPEPTD